MLQGNKSIKIILLSSAFSLIIISIIVFGVTKTIDTPPHKRLKTYDQFSAKNVLIKSFNDGKLIFVSKAKKIIHRDRTTELFRYHNLKELYFLDLTLEFFLGESNFLLKKSVPNMVEDRLTKNIVGIFLKKDNNVQIIGNSNINNIIYIIEKPDYKIITRAVTDNFLIIVHFTNNSSVKISSDNAVINFESHNIEFKKNFSIIDTRNKKITAPEAIWIYNSNHLFFPKGYILFPFKHRKKASFFIDKYGRLKKLANPLTAPLKKDKIDEMEEIIEAKFIAPYLNAIYTSLLTKGKIDFSIFKKNKQLLLKHGS
jgi:hypothetical protein